MHTAIDTDLDRILVTFGLDDAGRAAVWLTRFVNGDLVGRTVDLDDVTAHTINVLTGHDDAAANQDRASLAIALRAAADTIAASVVLVPTLPLELEAAPPPDGLSFQADIPETLEAQS